MRIAVFSLRFDDDGAGFDDSALQEFCAGHRVVDVAHHLVEREGALWLVVIVTWRESEGERGGVPQRRTAHLPGRSDDVDQVEPEVAERFEALRSWRNQYGRQSGKPVYLVFNNRQALEIARLRPPTLTSLAAIRGIGPSKVETWGSLVIDLLAGIDGKTSREPASVESSAPKSTTNNADTGPTTASPTGDHD